MKQSEKTHCKKGHEFSPENTHLTRGRNFRHCRACVRDQRNIYHFGDKDRREQVIQRDGEKCVQCGMTRAEHRLKHRQDITVDHIVSRGRWDSLSPAPNNSFENLQTLCVTCHSKKDRQRRKFLKIDPRDVADIKLFIFKGVPLVQLAKMYKVNYMSIHNIKQGRQWKDIKMTPVEPLDQAKEKGTE